MILYKGKSKDMTPYALWLVWTYNIVWVYTRDIERLESVDFERN